MVKVLGAESVQIAPPNPFLAWDHPKVTENDMLNLVAEGILYNKLVGEWCEPGDHHFPST